MDKARLPSFYWWGDFSSGTSIYGYERLAVPRDPLIRCDSHPPSASCCAVPLSRGFGQGVRGRQSARQAELTLLALSIWLRAESC